jgi:hypothetical protein
LKAKMIIGSLCFAGSAACSLDFDPFDPSAGQTTPSGPPLQYGGLVDGVDSGRSADPPHASPSDASVAPAAETSCVPSFTCLVAAFACATNCANLSPNDAVLACRQNTCLPACTTCTQNAGCADVASCRAAIGL